MKVCFPVLQDQGLDSAVYNHFGSAPVFIVVDTESKAAGAIINRDQQHEHGACNPIKALGDRKIDAVVVGGIGAGALGKLGQLGIRVFRAELPTIRENLEFFLSQKLSEYTPQGCCGGHGSDGACAH